MIEIIETTIGDIAKKIRTGKTPPTKNKLNFDNGNYNWFTPGDFTVPKVLESSKRKITDYAVENNAIVYEKNTVLVTCIGEIGNAGIIKEKASANQQITGINVKEGIILPEFFLYWFKANKDRVKNKANKAVVPILNNRALREIKVSFPKDLQTQNKIVTLLDKANTLILQRKKSITLLEELLRGQFLELFGDPVLNPKGWEYIKLKELGKWKSGGTPLKSKKRYYTGDIPWVSSGELNDVYISKAKEHITEEAINNSNAKLISKGSLLLGMYDTAALKSSISQITLTCNQAIAYSLLDEEKCLKEFVYYNIQYNKEYLKSKQRGARQQNMNLTMIRNIEVFDAPMELQQKFHNIAITIHHKKQTLKTSLNHLQDLFQSLLQKAFKGELTFNLKAELNSLLAGISPIEESNDWSGFRNNTTTTEELLRRLNQQEFEDQEQYQQAKWVVQQLLEEGQVEQVQEEGSTSLRIRKA